MKIKHLEEVFKALCQSKASKMNVISSDYESSKKEAIFGMDFKEIRLEIIYTKKNKMFIPPSMIYVRIYLDKTSIVYYHLPEIISFLEEYDFRACYFPYIENIYRMNSCFEALFSIVEEYLDIIEEWDIHTKNRLYEFQKEFLMREFNEVEVDDEDFLEFERKFYEKYYYLSRYSVFEGYYAFLQEDYLKAIGEYEKLAKKDSLTAYEIQLVEYMKTIETYDAIFDECFALDAVQPYLETSKQNGKDLLLFTLIMYLPFAFMSCLLMFILQQILSHHTVVYCGVDWWWGLICGALPAIFGGIAFRREIMSCIKYKNLIRAFDFDDILNSDWVNRFALVTFIVSCLVSIGFVFILSFECVRFYEDYLDVPQENLIDKEVYRYENIENIYHIDARYNEYGDRIERESYIILFDNGEYLDLDGYTSIEVCENEILPLLHLDVEYADSNKDLTFYKE